MRSVSLVPNCVVAMSSQSLTFREALNRANAEAERKVTDGRIKGVGSADWQLDVTGTEPVSQRFVFRPGAAITFGSEGRTVIPVDPVGSAIARVERASVEFLAAIVHGDRPKAFYAGDAREAIQAIADAGHAPAADLIKGLEKSGGTSVGEEDFARLVDALSFPTARIARAYGPSERSINLAALVRRFARELSDDVRELG